MTIPLNTFFAAWSIADSAARLEKIDTALTATARYSDPRTPAPLTGPSAIAEYVGMFAQAAPGATATVVKSDETDGMTRATIEFRMADGMVQHGQYFIEYETDKISRMVGFVGTGTPE